MKKFFIFVFALSFSFSIMDTAKAALTDYYIGADHFVYDSITNLTWYDAPAVYYSPYDPITQTNIIDSWALAVAWANDLSNQNFGGHNSWQLPSIDEMVNLNVVLGYPASPNPNFSPFENLLLYGYWSDTESDSGHAWDFYFGYGPIVLSKTGYGSYALAVYDGNISSVPEPTTMLLLGLGLIGLAGVRRKFKEQ